MPYDPRQQATSLIAGGNEAWLVRSVRSRGRGGLPRLADGAGVDVQRNVERGVTGPEGRGRGRIAIV